MNRFKIILEYDGGSFCGWQRQDHGKSVQGTVEWALLQFMKEEIVVYGASRTDAGVHALGQVAHFDSSTALTCDVIMRAANHYLALHRISLLECTKTTEDFHARFSAQQKLYRYVILNRKAPSCIDRGYLWQRQGAMNVNAMREVALLIEGRHDFIALKTAQCQAKSSVKTLDKIDLQQDGDKIIIELRARSFIHKMVRNIVGTLTMVGLEQWDLNDVIKILSATQPIKQKVTAPACGLYLVKVFY
jgi:tRNA pseudouridine38-40 synthase